MFFFAIVGVRPRLLPPDPARVGETRVQLCPGCGAERRFQARVQQTWFELFFLPIFPIGGRREVLACPSCRLTLDAGAPPGEALPAAPVDVSTLVQCPHCGRSFELER